MVESDVSVGSAVFTRDDVPTTVDCLVYLCKDGPVCGEIVCSLKSGIQDLVDSVGPVQVREESESVD